VENPYYAETWQLEYLIAQWKLKVKEFKRISTYLNTRYQKEATLAKKKWLKILGVTVIGLAIALAIAAGLLTVAIFQYNIELMVF